MASLYFRGLACISMISFLNRHSVVKFYTHIFALEKIVTYLHLHFNVNLNLKLQQYDKTFYEHELFSISMHLRIISCFCAQFRIVS